VSIERDLEYSRSSTVLPLPFVDSTAATQSSRILEKQKCVRCPLTVRLQRTPVDIDLQSALINIAFGIGELK
jgi:hypothetical protein